MVVALRRCGKDLAISSTEATMHRVCVVLPVAMSRMFAGELWLFRRAGEARGASSGFVARLQPVRFPMHCLIGLV